MSLTFPASPTVGDTYTVGARTWTWSGTIWEITGTVAAAGSIGTTELADSAITTAKIAAGAVAEADIADGAVTTAKIAAGAVVEADIAANAVTQAKLASTLSGVTVCTSSTRPASPFTGQYIYMTDVSQEAVWSGTTWVGTAPIAGGRNAVINGAFNVWQRGTSFNGSAPYYGADRWFFARPGAVAGSTLSRQASGLTGFTYCARMQRDSGNTNTSEVRIFQSLETINSLQFAGKQITVSFYVRSGANYSGGSNTRINVGSGTGTDQQLGNTGYTGYALVAQLATITPTSTWTRYSVTGSVSSSATEIGFEINYTPTGTAGANDFIEITGVQLEAGAVATPFEFEDYGVTLSKCKRYFYTIPTLGLTVYNPYWNVGLSGGGQWTNYNHPVEMRAVPILRNSSGGTLISFSYARNDAGASFNGNLAESTMTTSSIVQLLYSSTNNSNSLLATSYTSGMNTVAMHVSAEL